jgi:cell division septum initiation protein DivIVA
VSHAFKRIEALEAENKRLKAELETMKEALAGAHRIVRQIRDQDSTLSEVPIAPLDN